MTDPIEIMAAAICVARDGDEWDALVTDYDRELATAALAALRETLVPVGWMHQHERGESVLSRKPMTRGADELGWTETPLFALPEIKP